MQCDPTQELGARSYGNNNAQPHTNIVHIPHPLRYHTNAAISEPRPSKSKHSTASSGEGIENEITIKYFATVKYKRMLVITSERSRLPTILVRDENTRSGELTDYSALPNFLETYCQYCKLPCRASMFYFYLPSGAVY
jgi:hypothetical protein